MRQWTRRRFGAATPGTGRYAAAQRSRAGRAGGAVRARRRRGQADRRWRAEPELEQEPGLHEGDRDPDQNGTYGTRQSNKKDGDGGGAIYGCRSAPGREPCIRANNLKNGRAFEFDTRSGTQGGYIDVGSGNPNANATPFGTNAAGKVANLNADRVDDLHADEIIARAKDQWAVVGLRRGADPQERRRLGDEARRRRLRGRVRRPAWPPAPTTRRSAAPTRADPPAGEVGVAQRGPETRTRCAW